MRTLLQRSILGLTAALVLALAPVAPAGGQEKQPSLILDAVRVDPASPGPNTLCRLTVTLRNTGDRPASALELTVKLNGRPLPAYKDRIYMHAVEPGAAREIRLFNFWSTETGRPAPADGKLALEVTLNRAAWVQKETKDGAVVWTPLGPVAGLPAAKSISLKLGKK